MPVGGVTREDPERPASANLAVGHLPSDLCLSPDDRHDDRHEQAHSGAQREGSSRASQGGAGE